MAEDPQPMTLQQRIAALNASHINRVPGDPPSTRPKPQIPLDRPAIPLRQQSAKPSSGKINSLRTDDGIGNLPTDIRDEKLPPPPIVRTGLDKSKPAPPPLPKRQSHQPCPALPPRRPTEGSVRRDSFESTTSSVLSSASGRSLGLSSSRSRESSTSRVKAPAWGECELPPLPQKQVGLEQRKYSAEKPKYHNRAPSGPLRVSPTSHGLVQDPPEEVRPLLPPRLPARRQTDHSTDLTLQSNPPQNIPPLPSAATNDIAKRSALSLGMNKSENPPLPADRLITNGIHTDSAPGSAQPPAIPIASRPDLSAIQGSKPRPPLMANGIQPSSISDATTCMVCRDFAAPDHHAALFPRQGVQSLPTLAQQLTSPFASPTDKARTIFTWLHHNIRYDTESFFSNNVKASTPNSTLQSGLAVCEGFAALFTTLATHSGLESVVISGHGKGYGYTPLETGAVVPAYNAGHAWNAVRIDDGEWKLIDACWGAGHVQGAGKPFVQRFEPRYFTMSNEEFGIKHFPGNKDMFFLPGGRCMEWEEYIRINPASWPSTVEPPTVFSNARPDYGVGARTVMPRTKILHPSHGGVIRLSFELECPHWTLDRHTKRGPPPVFILAIHGVDGRQKDFLALDHVRGRGPGGGGDTWFVDVEARQLGAPGQTTTLFAVSSFGDRQDARGLSVSEFRDGKGKTRMNFSGVAAWELA